MAMGKPERRDASATKADFVERYDPPPSWLVRRRIASRPPRFAISQILLDRIIAADRLRRVRRCAVASAPSARADRPVSRCGNDCRSCGPLDCRGRFVREAEHMAAETCRRSLRRRQARRVTAGSPRAPRFPGGSRGRPGQWREPIDPPGACGKAPHGADHGRRIAAFETIRDDHHRSAPRIGREARDCKERGAGHHRYGCRHPSRRR